VLAGLLVGGTLLAWLGRDVALGAAARAAAAADLYCVLGIGALTGAFLCFKTWRWRLLLADASAGAGALFRSVALGSAVNYSLPYAGELARVAGARRSSALPSATLLASIGAERVFDLLVLAGFGLVMVWAYPSHGVLAGVVAGVGLASLLAALLIVGLLAAPERVDRGAQAVARALGPRAGAALQSQLVRARAGLEPLRSPRRVGGALLLSVLQWTCMSACVVLAMRGVGLEYSLAAALGTQVCLAAGLLLPSAPGQAGTTQLAFVLALGPLGHDAAQSIAASIVYNVVMVVTVLLVAACSLRPLALAAALRRGSRDAG
jgi:uncharacterized membrane protein YbhN (UPF0104 family)